jgi:diacylglycerol kinase (ATP)
MRHTYQKIHVVINPASGENQPILNVLNDVFHEAGIKWDASITHAAGDAALQAKEAANAGADLIAAYGGDGTQMEVANGLLGTGVPQAILPGGTGNAMAHELKIPLKLNEAAQLIASSRKRRAIDMAKMEEKAWMLRLYTGITEEEAASREKKDKLGQLAYIQASLKILTHIQPTKYLLTVDGEKFKGESLMCFILNAGSIGGVMGISLPEIEDVDISDGYLDLYAVTRGVQPLQAVTHYLFNIGDSKAGVYHWKGKEITLQAEPEQDVWIDGEIDGRTPITARVLHKALEIVVPE